VGKYLGKESISIWEENIETNLKEIRCEDRRWIKVPQGRIQRWILVFAEMSFRVLVTTVLVRISNGERW
jgi:hypothetical protein